MEQVREQKKKQTQTFHRIWEQDKFTLLNQKKKHKLATRTPEYMMQNLENQAFKFGQNFQKFSIFVQMASGVQQKVQIVFR
jgi:hypothetical protein